MLDTLLLRPSLHFTTLHPTTHAYIAMSNVTHKLSYEIFPGLQINEGMWYIKSAKPRRKHTNRCLEHYSPVSIKPIVFIRYVVPLVSGAGS